MYTLRQPRLWIAVLVALAFLTHFAVVLLLASTVSALKEDRAGSEERLRTAITCLLANQNDHRVNNKAGMEHLLRLHNFDPASSPAPPPLPDLPPGDVACAPFRTMMR